MAANQEIKLIAEEAVAQVTAQSELAKWIRKVSAAKIAASNRAARRGVRSGMGEWTSGKTSDLLGSSLRDSTREGWGEFRQF